MSAEENKALVRRYFEEFWNKGDVAFIEECFAPQVLVEGKYLDRDVWRDARSAWLTAFPDLQHHVDQLIAEGDVVAADIRFTGTHRGVFHQDNWGPWAPTAKSVEIREMNFFRLNEGKIAEYGTTWDGGSFKQQLGGDPSQATTTT